MFQLSCECVRSSALKICELYSAWIPSQEVAAGVQSHMKLLGGGVLHRPQNPDPISDQNILFFIPLFRPDPENLYPISDLVLTLLPGFPGLASVCTMHHLKRSE